jgi:hypothetical protein
MMESWSLAFVREWLPYMTLPSVLRFCNYELRRASGAPVKGHKLKLQMRSPIKGLDTSARERPNPELIKAGRCRTAKAAVWG